MSTATFTVPLTARVLRAILADIEGASGCGCHAPRVLDAKSLAARDMLDNIAMVPTAPLASGDSVVGDLDRDIELRAADITSGVVEQGNPFQTADGPVDLSNTTGPTIVYITPPPAPEGPFILTPEGIVPVDEVTDPFVLQTATPPVPPMPPAPVVTPPTSTVLLDSEGLPWDKRIHASTRTKRVGDDTWKLMKGVDKALVEQVKAELRATMAVPTPPQHPAFTEPTNYSGAQSGGYVPPEVVPHLSGSWSPETGHVVGVPTPPVTIVPAPPAPVATSQPPVVPTVPGAPTTFSDFVTYATNKIVGKQFSRDQLQAACANEGITSMPMLENRPDLIPAIWKFLESISIQASSVGGE